ncbi:Hydroxyacylglutathione hydrolase GloB [Candidatus Ecksteinia adelgidicola]|nr:Hydroxyacylglutathione hydrolase GloB [Candidatus Ecksteinia adelgidicola]
MKIIGVSTLLNNYVWLLNNYQHHCVIIDPGESQLTLNTLKNLDLIPDTIFLTHHHQDHVNGISELIKQYSNIRIYGPKETICKGAHTVLQDGDILFIHDREYKIFSLPGHTLGHLGFYSHPYLFCGDTLFSAGCGRLMEGTAKQMYHSLQKIAKLPNNTLIYCAHEYTLENIMFARTVFQEDLAIQVYEQDIRRLRKKNIPSIPTILQLEKKINLFLRCHDFNLQKKIGFKTLQKRFYLVFSELRFRKDNFHF